MRTVLWADSLSNYLACVCVFEMLVCVCGGMGKTSLVHRLMYGTFSLWHRPTEFREVHHGASMDVVDVPSTEHGVPMRCDVLVLIDCAEGMSLLRRWFGLYNHLVVVRRGGVRGVRGVGGGVDRRCTPYWLDVNSLSGDGVNELRALILRLYK